MGTRAIPRLLIIAGLIQIMPATLWAQAISGVVRDSSGGVLPGVTVEASSPALIEKTRTVVSDSNGQYRIVSLSPGTYTVTFTLVGFVSVKHDGIKLTTGFSANVDASMSVGGLEETVLVSGQSPIVDVHTVKQTSILTAENIQVLPTGRTSTGLAQLIPGISVVEGGLKFQDVGGLSGEGNSFVIHGSRFNEGAWLVNGMPYHNLSRANSGIMRPDVGIVQEFALETSAISAEYREGGVAMNLVGKDGGNDFSGSFFGSYANDKMQAENFDEELQRRGVAAVNGLDVNYDVNLTLGGPLRRNKLWFFGSYRVWGTHTRLAGIFDDSNRSDFLYTPDLSRQSINEERVKNAGLRLTWQVTPKNKIQAYFQQQPRVGFAGVLALMPEAQTVRDSLGNGNIYNQVLWSAPLTTKLLLEAGTSYFLERTFTHEIDGLPTNSPNYGYHIVDAGYNYTYNYPASIGPGRSALHAYKASVSYVTGSHALKAGFSFENGTSGPGETIVPRDMTLQFLNGVPNRITLQVSPRFTLTKLDAMVGAYITDQWTMDRLTMNLGLRFDYNRGSVPAQDQPAGRFLPARHYDEVNDVPNWKDLGPRIGVAYDLFGDGRTAIKGSLSRYVGGGNLVATANASNPVATTVNSANRQWIDDGDFIPECDFLNPAINNECGVLGNINFGRNVITTVLDSAITRGFGVRPHNWETTASVSHQLTSRIGIQAGYYHRQYAKFTVSDNTLVSPTDFDEFCITTPVDSRLPGGGGERICGLYDINPTKVNQAFTNVTRADNFGKQEDVYDGIDVSVTTRLRGGTLLQGGFSTGRQRTNSCFTVDSPQATLTTPGAGPEYICDVRPPFQTQAKLLASFGLPWDLQVSGTFQTSPGAQITATYLARSADILPSLGRHLAAGPNSTAAVEIIAPGTLYGPRVYQVDTRLSKTFPAGRMRIQGNFDLFNIFNANPVLQHNNVYGVNGATWLQPQAVMPARLAKLGVQITF